MTVRRFRDLTDYLDPTSKHYRKSHEYSAIFKWMTELTDIEALAMDLIRPFDPTKVSPILLRVTSRQEVNLFDYFRVLYSSDDQNTKVNVSGRTSNWMVFDEVSGAFLGLFSLTDSVLPWVPFNEWAGGVIGARTGGHNTHHTVINLRRCLPEPTFGQLTGGKFLALLASSRDVLSMYELRYSFPVTAIVVKTTHGKSSQYNRLRGFEYRGLSHDGAGVYIVQCREHSKQFLLEQRLDPGRELTYGAADHVAHWKSRWLPNRIGRTDNGVCRPDPTMRLSDLIEAKVRQRMANDQIKYSRKGRGHVDGREEGTET